MMLSQSEIATWTRDPRKWFVEYFLGYQSADESPVGNKQLGIRVHTALQAHYGHDLPAAAVLALLYRLEIEAQPEFEIELKQEMALGLIMVSGYVELVEAEGWDAELETVAVEQDMQVPLPGPVPGVILRCRLDRSVRNVSDGSVSFVDYKTSGNFDAHETLELNPQFKFYCMVQQLAAGTFPNGGGEGNPVAVTGGIMRTLRRVKRTSASKPPYYMKDSIRYNPQQMMATYDRTRQVALEISAARAELDAAYAAGGRLEDINLLQRRILRPVPIAGNCEWYCPLSKGLCQAMDDGSDWPGILVSSGRYVQVDPYARYSEDPLRTILEKIASL
jgi:RecB family exonuclease